MSIQDKPSITLSYEEVDTNELSNQTSIVEQNAARIENLARKEKCKRFVENGGLIAMGAIGGICGLALVIEIASKVYNFVIPEIMRLIFVLFGASILGIFVFTATPIAIYAAGGCDCNSDKIDV